LQELTNELRAMREDMAAMRDAMTRLVEPAEYLTPQQTADYLKVSVDALIEWRRERRGPKFVQSSSRFVRYRRADVDAWAAENLVN